MKGQYKKGVVPVGYRITEHGVGQFGWVYGKERSVGTYPTHNSARDGACEHYNKQFQCAAIAKNSWRAGQRCPRPARKGSKYCGFHKKHSAD